MQSGAIDMSLLNCYIQFSPSDAMSFAVPASVNSVRYYRWNLFKMAGMPNVWSYRTVQIDRPFGEIWNSHGSRDSEYHSVMR
jgi:hypothetical protein